ncbi:MAG: HlyD family efflux transporter periplasmic adaptor subunit, partial [Desulfobacterales bacterium]|nr:HlyD family efflux transporter periplasmic adaptor subunit [Desulfobacterales bacterium]
QVNPLRVEVVLPAEMLRQIKPGMTAQISPELEPEKKYTATVTIIDRMIDSASHTFGVRLELPNIDYKIPGGLRCTVQFDSDTEIASGKTKDSLNKDM